jgi:hypothetical protein
MNSTPAPKATEPRDASIAGAGERLAHAHEQLVHADEQLARLSEQVARMERNAARAPSALFRRPSPPGRRALGAIIGLPLAACIVVAAVALQSSLGGGAKPVVAPSPPQLASAPALPPENPPLAAEPAPPPVQVAAVEEAPAQATAVAQAAPQDAAPTITVPTAAAAPPDQTQLLQTMARDLANLERSIEQLKTAQQKTAGDHAKEVAELKASQEEMKRALAKVSEQNVSRASPPPVQATQPAPTLRKPERTVHAPRARARPRIPPEWYYDDW